MKRTPLLAALVVLGMSGCGEGVSPAAGGPATVPAPTTARERLEADSMEFRALPVLSSGEFVARRVLQDSSSAVALSVFDGWFEVRARNDALGARLDVSRLEIALRDVKLTPAQLPPRGLTLTQITVVMEEPTALSLRWYGDGRLGWARGVLPLEVRMWVRMSNGDVSPLEFVHLAVPIELSVCADSEHVLSLSIDLNRAGVWSEWGGLFALSDLTLGVEALETTPLDQLPPRLVLE